MTRSLLLALAALALGAPAAHAATADVALSIVGRPAPVTPGQYVSYTLAVDNNGPDASDVTVTVPLSPKVSFISATHECAFAAGTVTCQLPAVVAGAHPRPEIVVQASFGNHHSPIVTTATATTSATDPAPANNTSTSTIQPLFGSHDHHAPVEKVEQQVDFDPGQTRTVQVTCPQPGAAIADGSLRIDAVDQGTGTLRSVVVTESRSVAYGTWQVTATNTATGRAQTKLFGLCLPARTDTVEGHDHELGLDPATTTQTIAGVAGRNDVSVSCADANARAVAPGYAFGPGAAGEWVTSEPTDTGWHFGFVLGAPGPVTVSVRCLDTFVKVGTTGHTHQLWLSHPDAVAIFPADTTDEQQVTCSDEAKGIVGTFDLGPGLHLLGHDPRPKTRAYKVITDGAPAGGRFDLLCLGDRVGPDPPPPAGPRSLNPTTTASSTGATVPVGVTCPAGGCSGSVRVVRNGRTIGTANLVSYRAGASKVDVTIRREYRRAIREGRIRSVEVRVVRADGRVVVRRTVALRRR